MAKKILLADDSPTIRKVVELTFADEGIEVHSVPDGDAAMVKFVQIEPDMVIADVNMPGMSGYRLCEMIKEDETTRHIPVILLVGSFEPFDPGEASRVGSNYYFTKPFRSIRELVDKVHECFATGGVGSADEIDDIEGLYNDSLESSDETSGPEEDAAAYSAPSEIEETPRLDETGQFDDGATLDEILQETRSDGGSRSQAAETQPVESAAEASEPAASEDAKFHQPLEESSVDDFAGEEPFTGDHIDAGDLAIHRTFDDENEDLDATDADPVDLEIPPAGQTETASVAADEIEWNGDALPSESDADAAAEMSLEPEVTTAASVAASAGESFSGVAASSPWEQPIADAQSAAVPELHNTTELGDAGMDDEIIEAVHPNGSLAVVEESVQEPVQQFEAATRQIDPFHERVAHTENELNDLTASTVMPFPGTEPRTEESRREFHEAAVAETAVAAPALGSHVTPELIESIVASVLEKMSDRAVRDAAQEAVPRIAEKLIREALVDDKKD